MDDIIAVRGRQAAAEAISRLESVGIGGLRPVSVAELGGGRSLTPRTFPPRTLPQARAIRAERPMSTGRLAIGVAWRPGDPATERRPLTDCAGAVLVVYSGTIDNATEVRAGLETTGHQFLTADDGEIIPHTIEDALARGGDTFRAFQTAVERIRGLWAVAALIARHNSIFIARFGSPLSVRGTVGRCVVATNPAASEGVRGPLRILEDGSIAELGTAWRWAGAPGRPPLPTRTANPGPRLAAPTANGWSHGTLQHH